MHYRVALHAARCAKKRNFLPKPRYTSISPFSLMRHAPPEKVGKISKWALNSKKMDGGKSESRKWGGALLPPLNKKKEIRKRKNTSSPNQKREVEKKRKNERERERSKEGKREKEKEKSISLFSFLLSFSFSLSLSRFFFFLLFPFLSLPFLSG